MPLSAAEPGAEYELPLTAPLLLGKALEAVGWLMADDALELAAVEAAEKTGAWLNPGAAAACPLCAAGSCANAALPPLGARGKPVGRSPCDACLE